MVRSDNIIDAVNSFVNALEEEQKKENIVKIKSDSEKDVYKSKTSQEKPQEVHVTRKKERSSDIQDNHNEAKLPEINESGLQKLADIVRKAVEIITQDKDIKVQTDSEKYRISVYGKDLAIAIGKNGTGMNALEYLINLIGKRKKLVDKNVILDIKDYRKKNDDKIKEIAINMAKKALKERKTIALRPMPSHERKIVHNILSKVKNIRTKSRDDEPNRRIVIYPVIKE